MSCHVICHVMSCHLSYVMSYVKVEGSDKADQYIYILLTATVSGGKIMARS